MSQCDGRRAWRFAASTCAKTRKCPVNVRLILELLRQIPYLVPRYFT